MNSQQIHTLHYISSWLVEWCKAFSISHILKVMVHPQIPLFGDTRSDQWYQLLCMQPNKSKIPNNLHQTCNVQAIKPALRLLERYIFQWWIWKGGSSVHVTDSIKRAKPRALGGVALGGWDMSPRKIFDFGSSEIAFGAVLEWNSVTNCQSSPCVWNL